MIPELLTPIPGPKSRALAAELRRYESRNVTFVGGSFPIFWQRALGGSVWDVDGNRFLDLTSAFGVAGLGHSPPPVYDALLRQAGDLMHAMGDVHPAGAKVRLCRRLSELTFERWGLGAGKTILGNSGFEAVEAALKTSLLHSGKPGVIAFTGAYHGLGFGALAAGGLPFFRDPFRPQFREFAAILPYPSCYRCPYGVREEYRLAGDPFPNCSASCLGRLREEILRTVRQREIGAVLVEPMQGRGGEIVPPLDFMRMLRQICDEEKLLLIADEIYTGLNRTGRLFACEHSGVAPDIICLGKALTSGFPLSACVGRADIMDAWPPSPGEALHTSTFLGSPLGCAMALSSLELHSQPELAARVRDRGQALREALRGLRGDCIGDVRGCGLLAGIEIVGSAGEPAGARAAGIVDGALRAGLILLAGGPAGNVLSFSPAFEISNEEIAFAAETLQSLISS